MGTISCSSKGILKFELNGRDSACRYKQKWKGYRNFPPASILAWGPGNKFSLKVYNFSRKWAILKVIFVLSSWNNHTPKKLICSRLRSNDVTNIFWTSYFVDTDGLNCLICQSGENPIRMNPFWSWILKIRFLFGLLIQQFQF